MSGKRPKEPLPKLSADARTEAEAWLKLNGAHLPAAVSAALNLSLLLATKLASAAESRRSILMQLRLALGILPSSERRKNCGDPLVGSSKDASKGLTEAERLADELSRLRRLKDWHGKLSRRHGKRLKDLEARLMNLEDIPLTPEDEAELLLEEAEFDAHVALGARCDLDCAAPAETLMKGAVARTSTEEVDCEVDRDGLPRGTKIKQQFFEDRERIGFSFNVTRFDISVEKLSIQTPAGPSLVAASVEDIGPPKSKVTWEFLTSMAIMVAQYAMPLNRFAALASSPFKTFTAGEMSRHFHYVAERFLAIYLELGHDLANSAVLCGDDTPSRVVEVNQTLKQQRAGKSIEPPWKEYATAAKAEQALIAGAEPTLALQIAAKLGFESDRKDGTGTKVGFNTTILSGRTNGDDPRSTIVFFRSHMGGFGNLLTGILSKRRLDNPDLLIQSDLSTVNLISDESLRKRLRVNIIGCSNHARRPFAQFEDDDPEICAWILHSFKGLAIYEKTLDAHGRNSENSIAVRGTAGQRMWDEIKEAATMLTKKWSRETDLGEAARYIIRHFDRLTYYLRDHRLAASNNFSERMLRLERLIENNALFRQKLEGRFALDIVRTILQTGIAANVNLDLYMNWVLRMPPDVVAASPHEFTPLAFAHLNSQLP